MGEGYQVKYRMSPDGEQVVAYLPNVAGIALHKPETPPGSLGMVTGSCIRVRKPAGARLAWRLPRARYPLTVRDRDTGERREEDVAGRDGAWRRDGTDHDFVLVWRQR